MMLSAATVALALSSALAASIALVAAAAVVSTGVRPVPDAASTGPLRRARRSLLAESATGAVVAFEALIFFLFLATADRLHGRVPGATCAAGAIAASRFGYPLVALQASGFVLAATSLVLSRATRTLDLARAVRTRRALFVGAAAVVVAQAGVQAAFLADLDTSLASCCAPTAAAAAGVASALAELPAPPLRAAFPAALAATLAAGAWTLRRAASPVWFALSAVLLGGVAVASLAAWIGPDFYGVASHRCAFCLLGEEHHHVGYALYAALAAGVVTALSSGAVRAAGPRARAIGCLPELRLCRASVASWLLFALLAWAPFIGDLASSRGNNAVH